MTWELCSLELPAKERVRSRNLSFVAVTPGDCVKSIATLDLPATAKNRARNLKFVALPVFTESEIAELNLPAKANIRARGLNFVAVNLECPLQEASGMDCVPIHLEVSGEANFGDFSEEQIKSYTFGYEYNDDDSFAEYTILASGSSYDTVTMAVKYARNMFFDPEDIPIKVGTTSGVINSSSSSNQTSWYFQNGQRLVNDDPNKTFSRSSSNSEDYTFETNAQSYTYPRKRATISCSTDFYPVDFIGKYRYGIPYDQSSGYFPFGREMTYSGFTAGSALFSNNHIHTSSRSYSQSYEENRWNWSSYNFKDKISFDPEDHEPVDEKTTSIEYLTDAGVYAQLSDNKTLQYNYTDNRGVLSPISFYSKNADVTLEGEVIDISRVPVPCSYIAKAIIKLDGKIPNRCGVSYVTSPSPYEGNEGIIETSSLWMDGKYSIPWVWFHHYRGAASIGHRWWNSNKRDQGVYYNDFEMDQGSFNFTENFNVTLQDQVGLVDHSVSYSSSSPRLNDATNAYHFCLQLGPIYQKKYSTDLDLPGTSSSSFGTPQVHPDYKNPDYAEYKYLGFGWGLYLIDYFHNLDRTTQQDLPPSGYSMPVVHGPFFYSTHLSEFFEWTGPEWVSTYYDDYNEENIPIDSVVSTWMLHSHVSKYLKFKDKDYEDVDELNHDVENLFTLTPDLVSFSKSSHYSEGEGILNYAHAISDFTSSANVDQKYFTYNETSLYLNPFGFSRTAALKNKNNPLINWNFKDIFIYDRGHIINGGDEYLNDQDPLSVQLVPELIGKPINTPDYPFRPCDYVELNWDFSEKAYLHSVNEENSKGSEFKTLYGDYAELQEYSVSDEESGYSDTNPNALFNYPERDYFLPYGKATVEELDIETIKTLHYEYKFKLTFDWHQPEKAVGIYDSPFVSESRRFTKTTYIKDFDLTEPFAQRFFLPGYEDLNLVITNINPNAWSFWLNRLYESRNVPEDERTVGVGSYEKIFMYPRPTFVDVNQE